MVEEIAVVGHHEQRQARAAEIALEPHRHVEVEVVGRLVEDEEVGLRQQCPRQCHAFLLAAAQLPHGLRQVADAQLGEHLSCPQRPFFAGIGAKAGVEHLLIGLEMGLLLEVAQPDVVVEHDATVVVTLVTGDDLEQCRLTGAVAGNESHLLTGVDGEADVVHQHAGAERFRQMLNVKI